MKKIVLAMLLVAMVTAVAQTASQPNSAPAQSAPQPGAAPPATAAPPAAAAPAQQKKEIKDPAEYNAYVGALQQTDPTAKVSGLTLATRNVSDVERTGVDLVDPFAS